MDFSWFIQTIIISFTTIALIHYAYVYFIDNFTEVKIKDPEVIHSNYSEILNLTQNKKKDEISDEKSAEDINNNMNMKEELELYLQQQLNEHLIKST